MAAVQVVNLYAVIVALLCFVLAFIVIWSRRELRMRLIALGFSFGMPLVVYLAFSQLPGKPSSMSVDEFRERYRCATIVPVGIKQGVEILMVAKKQHARDPEYLSVEWNMRLAASLQKSMRVAKLNGKGSIIYGAQSCHEDGDEEGDGDGKGKKGKKGKGKGKPGAGQSRPGLQQPGSSGQEPDSGDGFTFYPDPVPAMPEKNYGPLYEGPIEIPEQR